jgi:hypothetical protein
MSSVVAPLTGNDKRKDSCKKVGGAKKRVGHQREELFNAQFGTAGAEITYRAEADCTLSKTPSNETILRTLGLDPGDPTSWNVSLKSGNNLQFTLGNIPEITSHTEQAPKLAALSSSEFWNKYLKKCNSQQPCGILSYLDEANTWTFFSMDKVIQHVIEHTTWRMLDTGRIKGDMPTTSKKGSKQVFTYEYRPTHKSHFFGANGGQGKTFIGLLKECIPSVSIQSTQ